jgi:hypothetical protein
MRKRRLKMRRRTWRLEKKTKKKRRRIEEHFIKNIFSFFVLLFGM